MQPAEVMQWRQRHWMGIWKPADPALGKLLERVRTDAQAAVAARNLEPPTVEELDVAAKSFKANTKITCTSGVPLRFGTLALRLSRACVTSWLE